MKKDNSRKLILTALSLTLVLALLIGKPDLFHKSFNKKRSSQKELVLPVNKLAENLAVNACSEEFLKSASDNAANFNVAKSGLNVFKARLAKEHKAAAKNFSALANQVILNKNQAASSSKTCIFPFKINATESLADSSVKSDILEVSLGEQSIFCSKGKAYLSDYSGFYAVDKVLDSNAKEFKKKKTIKALQKKLKDLKLRKAQISSNNKAQRAKIDKEINSLVLSINYAKFLSNEALVLVGFFNSVCSQAASIVTPASRTIVPDTNSPTAMPIASIPPTKLPQTSVPPTNVPPTTVPPIIPTIVVPSDFKIGDSIELIRVTNVRESGSLTGTLKGQQQIGARGTILAGPVSANNFTWWNVDFNSAVDGWTGEDNYKSYQPPVACTEGQTQTRVMYQHARVANGQTCVSETQTGTCVNGVYSNWTGTYTNPACYVEGLNHCASGSASVIGQFGITWTFNQAHTCGQFANGDYWVVGPVTIKNITPEDTDPNDTIDMHGTMINPAVSRSGTPYTDSKKKQSWDSRLKDFSKDKIWYDPALNIAKQLPKLIPTNSSVVSVESHLNDATIDNPQIKTAAVLTVLDRAPAAGSFRPPLVGTDKTIRWNRSQLNYGVLRSLAPVPSTPPLAKVESWFERPWIEKETGWTGRYTHPDLNYPNNKDLSKAGTYGREIAYAVEAALLSLQLNYTNEEKERLYIHLVQAGIDVYGAAKNGGYWGDGGGHNQGRKMVLLLTAKALGDSNILEYADAKKHLIFQEDLTTFYVTAPDTVRADGTMWFDNNTKQKGQLCNTKGSPFFGQFAGVNCTLMGAYTQTQVDEWKAKGFPGMPEWAINYIDEPHRTNDRWDAKYRTVAGSAYFGAMVTAVLMGVESEWNHPAFFDYLQNRYWQVEGPITDGDVNKIQFFAKNMYETHVLRLP